MVSELFEGYRREHGWKRTYENDPGVQNLQEVGDVGEIKDGQPSTVVSVEIKIDEHDEAKRQVGGRDETKSEQRLLVDADPWGMADAEKDGLLQ